MKYIKNIVLAATIAVASLGLTSFSANADLVRISQTIESSKFVGPIASFVIEFDYSIVGNGLFTTFDSDNLVDFTSADGTPLNGLDFYGFEAAIDGDNVFAGLELIYVDFGHLIFGSDTIQEQIFVDAFAPDSNQYEIVNITSSGFIDVDLGSSISFGQASVSFVSAPPVIALLAFAVMVTGWRRKRLIAN